MAVFVDDGAPADRDPVRVRDQGADPDARLLPELHPEQAVERLADGPARDMVDQCVQRDVRKAVF
jgi:hypothetical protein